MSEIIKSGSLIVEEALKELKDYIHATPRQWDAIGEAEQAIVSVVEKLENELETRSEALRQIMHMSRYVSIDTPIGDVVTMLQGLNQDMRQIAFKALGMDKVYASLEQSDGREQTQL